MSMSDVEFENRLRAIVTSSNTEEEVERRASDELNSSIAITSRQPTTEIDHTMAAVASFFGGSQLRSGAMVMVMAYGPSGEIIHI